MEMLCRYVDMSLEFSRDVGQRQKFGSYYYVGVFKVKGQDEIVQGKRVMGDFDCVSCDGRQDLFFFEEIENVRRFFF